MNLPTFHRDNLISQLLIVFAFSIPWAKRALPTLIAVIVLVALLQLLRSKSFTFPKSPNAVFGLFSIYLLLLIGVVYSEHRDVAWNEIGMKFSFFIFPFLALIVPGTSKEDVGKMQRAFVAGCFLFIGITLTHALYEIAEYHDFFYATYERLSWYIHPTYAAHYQAFALYVMTVMVIRGKYLFNRIYIHVIATAVLLLFVVLLSSKAGYLTVLTVLFYGLAQALWAGVPKVRAMVVFFVAASFFVFTIYKLPATSQRIENAVVDLKTAKDRIEQNDTSAAAGTSTHMRIVTWRASLAVLFENPFGTGTGDTQDALNTTYLQRDLFPAEKNLNAHNQFLQLGAELGWPGILALVFCLYSLFVAHGGDYTIRLFALLCALNFMFESVLETQAGIVFFSFWIFVYSRNRSD
jgi:O-antigen ligase